MWLNETYVNLPLWWHWLFIVVPDKVEYPDFATVIGTGGSNRNNQEWPAQNEEYFRCAQYIATHTKTIIAVLYQVCCLLVLYMYVAV